MSKETKIISIVLSIVLVMAVCFQAGFYVGLGQGLAAETEDPYLASIEEAWQNINTYYVEKDSLDHELLSQYAIEGMLEYLDDNHSAYLNPEAFAEDVEDTAGSYSGIGILASAIEEKFVVVRVYEGSPSEAAGICAGDIITAVDGVTTEGMSFKELIARVRGEEGTTVIIQVLHENAAELEKYYSCTCGNRCSECTLGKDWNDCIYTHRPVLEGYG